MSLKKALENILQEGIIIENPSSDELRHMAQHMERTTQYGSASYVTKVRHRSAKFTHVVDSTALPQEYQKTVDAVVAHLKTQELISVTRTMGDGLGLQCRTVYPKEYARIGYMWHNSLFPPQTHQVPQMNAIQVPDWPERLILVDPKENVTFVLGSDYLGESKKAHLRMGMHYIKQKGGLGLHAGSKLVRVKNAAGELVEKGVILFGLSGTGKTTLTVHDYGLSAPEGVAIRQDDVILMEANSYCHGTENGFFIKTEGLGPDQKVLHNAALQPHAIFENVHVANDGTIDFMNCDLTSNGRAIIQRKDIDGTDASVDLPSADIVVFITRRNDIVPPVARLTPEQGAAAFMLGESIETSAGDPSKAGQSKRVVGTNPFIVGSLDEEGNRFLEILKNNPHMQCYVLNTGKVGGEKLTIEDSTTIIREIARESVTWKTCPQWGYEIAASVPGVDTKKLDASNYYSTEEYERRVKELRAERVAWFKQFPDLKDEIKKALK